MLLGIVMALPGVRGPGLSRCSLPAKEVAAGYDPIMPSFAGRIDEAGIEDLIAYIKSLAATEERRR